MADYTHTTKAQLTEDILELAGRLWKGEELTVRVSKEDRGSYTAEVVNASGDMVAWDWGASRKLALSALRSELDARCIAAQQGERLAAEEALEGLGDHVRKLVDVAGYDAWRVAEILREVADEYDDRRTRCGECCCR